MEIKEFIEKAIEGGCEPFNTLHMEYAEETHVFGDELVVVAGDGLPYRRNIYQIFLDPKAWRAVGEVEGWKNGAYEKMLMVHWEVKMHQMIDALMNGESLEDYIKTL